MRFILVIFLLLLSACSTLDIYEVPENSKVLVVADTNDKFYLMYDGYAFLPINRPVYLTELKAPWLLSDLFVDYVKGQEQKSRFELLKSETNNVREDTDPDARQYGDQKHIENKLYRLARDYDVDYIFYLRSYSLSYQRGSSVIYTDMEYGYKHFMKLDGLFQREAIGFARSGIDITMYGVNLKNAEKPIVEHSCNPPAPLGYVEPLDIPTDMDRAIDSSEIPKAEADMMFDNVRKVFERHIQSSIEMCLFKSEYRPKAKGRNR